MSVTVEKKEHNMAVLTVTASAQELTQALNDAWCCEPGSSENL